MITKSLKSASSGVISKQSKIIHGSLYRRPNFVNWLQSILFKVWYIAKINSIPDQCDKSQVNRNYGFGITGKNVKWSLSLKGFNMIKYYLCLSNNLSSIRNSWIKINTLFSHISRTETFSLRGRWQQRIYRWSCKRVSAAFFTPFILVKIKWVIGHRLP